MQYLECSVLALAMNEQSKKKRPRGTPTGSTPQQVGKRSTSRTSGVTPNSKKKLVFAESSTRGTPTLAEGATPHVMASVPQVLPGSWTADEERALVEFIMTTTKGDDWPTTMKEKFWEAAAKFVSQRCSVCQRTCKHLVL